MIIQRTVFPRLQKELSSDQVIVLTGMRRVGKTFLVKSLYDSIQNRAKLYLDLENPLNQELFQATDYDQVKQSLEGLARGQGKPLVVILDEIQHLKTAPSIVKYLSDHYRIKFILTGSASYYLKNRFTESLAGRKRVFELFPLSFAEWLAYKNPRLTKPTVLDSMTPYQYHLYHRYFCAYLTDGGFPKIATLPSTEEKNQQFSDIFTSYFQNEVRLLSDFRKLDSVRQTILLLVARVGSRLDILKMSQELGISRITLEEYLSFLEETYFFRRIRAYSRAVDVTLRSQTKPYFCDHGLLKHLGKNPDSVILENAVFNLIRSRGEVHYYQSQGGAEVDFIISQGKKRTALEVKTFGRDVDVRRLARTARRLKIKDYFVVSLKYSPQKGIVYPFQL